MSDILLKVIEANDIPQWLKLSHEFDLYIKELVGSLPHWYDGNENDITFLDYMNSKIVKKEAVMVVERTAADCMGIARATRKRRLNIFAHLYRRTQYLPTSVREQENSR